MRAAHELMDVAASPLDMPGDERAVEDAELAELLAELEAEPVVPTKQPPGSITQPSIRRALLSPASNHVEIGCDRVALPA